jgi:hypothetical protein
MPGGLAREMRADDHRVLVLRSRRPGIPGTASEAVTRGKDRAWVELAPVKGLVAALTEAAVDPVALPITGGEYHG